MEKRLTMFEKTIDLIYESIGASINEKKRELKLKRKDMISLQWSRDTVLVIILFKARS